jgi:RHS repeat-associated protein
MDLNLTDSSLKKKYIYADRQILAQHDIDDDATPDPIDDKYFYLHDRLGSVRLVINDSGSVVSHYTYEPFGEVIDDDVTFVNDFLFTGQYFDFEIEEYYLRARQYNPHLARFTARDAVEGKFEQPLTLNRYLYCENDPINLFDPDGASSRSAAFGVPQFTFEDYQQLWAAKDDPQQENLLELTFWTGLFVVGEEVSEYKWPGAGTVFAPVSAGAAFLFAGPNMYTIMYYRMLQNGMINAILREDFGIDADLYDLQDFRFDL